MRYAIVIETAEGNYSAYAPDFQKQKKSGTRPDF